MQAARPFTYPGTDGDVLRLRELLAMGLKAAAWTPPQTPAILNLACGRADETGILVELLAAPEAPLFLLGIDLRAAEIDEANSRWQPACAPGQELEFRTGDASRINHMNSLPPFDLIFIRHQNYWSTVGDWTRLLRNALTALKDDGILVVTSYFDREHELASACLLQLGAERLADIPHPTSRPLNDAPDKSVDRRLAIFRQGDGKRSTQPLISR